MNLLSPLNQLYCLYHQQESNIASNKQSKKPYSSIYRNGYILFSTIRGNHGRLMFIQHLSIIIKLIMQQSRISVLLKNSRSRHEVINNPDLRMASYDNLKVKKQRIGAEIQNKKIASEVRYYESLNRRLLSKIQKQRISLYYAEQNRKRLESDIHKKRHYEELKNKQILNNQMIANKIKEQRQKRQQSVRLNKMQKSFQGSMTRNLKNQLRSQKYEKLIQQYDKNRSRVERVVQFECNLRESFIKGKQLSNDKHLKQYKQSILNNRKTIIYKRNKTQSAKEKLKRLTEGASTYITQLNEISNSIHQLRTSRKVSLSPLNFNRQKLDLQSRCVTHQNKSDMHNNSTDHSLFLSNYKTQT